MINEVRKKCPYCDANLVLKNGLLYCPKQDLFIGKKATAKNVPTTETTLVEAADVAPKDLKGEEIARSEILPEKMDEISLSGFWRRVFSVFIDSILLSLALGFIVSVLKSYSLLDSFEVTSLTALYETPWRTIVLSTLFRLTLVWGIVILYFTAFESIWGATIGKFITGERVVDLAGNKAPIVKIFIRNIFKPVDFLFGLLFFLFSRKNQIIGDKIAGTLVIQRNIYGAPIEGGYVRFLRKFVGVLIIISFAVPIFVFVKFLPDIKFAAFEFQKVNSDIIEKSSIFVESLSGGNFDVAFELMSSNFENNPPELVEEIKEYMINFFDTYPYQSQSQAGFSFNFSSDEPDRYEYQGLITYAGDLEGLVRIVFRKEEGVWKIRDFQFSIPN